MPTDSEIDAAATELRGTLEVMLARIEDTESARYGSKRAQSVWDTSARCDGCGKPVPGVVVTGTVTHVRCLQ